MLSRRQFLGLAGGATVSLALPGCAVSPPVRKDIFPEFGDAARPYLGLATSLREEYNYEARVEWAQYIDNDIHLHIYCRCSIFI
jgi:all-trans-8'-apo-beta-carotenal 15,15'-oxygenase